MSDEAIHLPGTPAAESIPLALANPSPKKQRRAVPVPVALPASIEPAPAFAVTPAAPTAAVPAEPTPPAATAAESKQEHETMATAAETVNKVSDTVKDVNETVKNQSAAMFADVKERAEDAVAKGREFWAEMAEFNKGNVEALVESGRVAARGFEQMGREAAEEARRSFDAAREAAQTLAQVKSPTEFVRLQGEYARAAFDQAVARTSRGTETMLKLTGEIAQPISNRVALAADKMKVAA